MPAFAGLLLFLSGSGAFGIGSSGWYATRIKMEYQYSDYNSYRYPDPIAPEYPDVEYQQVDPYIAEFPELRTLVRVTQAFGPHTSLQIRHQYSDLSQSKLQRLYYTRLAHDLTTMTNLYGAYQYLEQPGSLFGYMLLAGIRHDRAGWILGEASFSYLRNHSFSSVSGDPYAQSGALNSLVQTYAPMASLRYSLDQFTAVMIRWEGFWAQGERGNATSFIYTGYVSRYLPTNTALHLMLRYYDNDVGVRSLSPAVEVAQYLRWNLTLRVSYRYYENEFDPGAASSAVEGNSIRSHSLRTHLEWQVGSDLKLNFNYRRYLSNQQIRMNTYLVGFEYLI